ncbi:MAG: response regulator transcription factor [Actinobacteria bacterium]|nr:response regulator transcription factor [Actinomycetota bacterium]
MSPSIRVLVVDDHPVVRTGVQGMLASHADFEVVGEASDGEDAVGKVEVLNPDVVLMDLRMPGIDGVEATKRILARHPGVQVLVLTTYDTDEDIVRAVEAGAVGYLLKDSPREELFRGVHAAAQGEPLLAAAVASRLMGRMRTPPGQSLSPRELEVLMLVADGRPNKDIARSLYISETTVKTHVAHIFTKLGVDDRTAAVTVALDRGIIRLKR